MKYLLVALSLLIATPVLAACDNPKCTCGDLCKCDPCDCGKTEARVPLPNDASKLTVTVFAKNETQAKLFIAKHPQINQYKAGNHFNVYTAASPLVKSRFPNAPMPSAYVQKSNGQVVWATSSTACPLFGRWRNQQSSPEPTPDPVDEEEEESDSEEPAPEPGHPLLMVALAALAVAGGVGSKFYEELKAK